ncbi:MAG: hypothetical protein QXR53_03675 [Candidatus Norongarragalinales archaeon]
MNKLAIIAIVVVLALAGAAYFLLFAQQGVAEYSDPEEEQALRNTELYATLLGGGIQEPFVDVSEAQAYVAYELPEGFDSGVMQKFVIGAASASSQGSQKIIAVQYSGGNATTMWTVANADVEAWVNGQLNDEQFESKVEKKSL